MIDKQQEYIKMASAEKKLWWYRALHQLVFDALKSSKIPKDARILDAGCGTGGMMEGLQEKGYSVQGIDLSPHAVNFCQQKGLSVIRDDVRNVTHHFSPETFDVIISNDVLCYFREEEYVKLVDELLSLLKNKGLLIMNLPALKAFSGIHDLSVGLQQRFGKNDVAKISKLGQVEKTQTRYWPFLLSPLIYLIRYNQRQKLRKDPQIKIESDVSVPPAPLNRLLSGITSVELALPPFAPFGSSVFMVLQKKAS